MDLPPIGDAFTDRGSFHGDASCSVAERRCIPCHPLFKASEERWRLLFHSGGAEGNQPGMIGIRAAERIGEPTPPLVIE